MPKFVPGDHASSLWRSITSVGEESNVRGEVFAKGVGFLAGEERGDCFLLDD